MPLIIRYGNRFHGRRAENVQHLDILPTIFSILGLEGDPRWRGKDLFGDLPREREVYSEMYTKLVSPGLQCTLVRDRLKLVFFPEEREYRLYDLEADPLERKDLYGEASYREAAGALRSRLEFLRREDRLHLVPGPAPPVPGREERAKLRALGYGY